MQNDIEPPVVSPDAVTTDQVRDFWSRNVNAERILGREVSAHERGQQGYFEDLENQRYRSHRHLPAWIDSMRAGSLVLEVGCGIGLDACRMARRGLDVVAADLTDIGVSTASKRFAELGLTTAFVAASGEFLPFPDARFDYVYSFGVMHHAANTQNCVDEAFRVLKPGGQALIMLYHRHSLNELVHRLVRVPFEEKDELCPVVRRFTRDEVAQMFARFSRTEQHLEFVFGEGYGPLFRLLPAFLYRALSRRFGWHIMIRATK